VEPPREAAVRKADTLARLGAPAADVWVATAGDDGPYLVPLSLGWLGERVVVALEARSRTARNLGAHGVARLAVGPTRDLVVLDVVLEATHPAGQAPADIRDGYAAQADWDPRDLPGYVYLVLRPTRIQAWRESNEIAGRTLMRDGEWLA
jgi:hypothetical protein